MAGSCMTKRTGPELGEGAVPWTPRSPLRKPSAFGSSDLPLLPTPLPLGTTSTGGKQPGQAQAISTPTAGLPTLACALKPNPFPFVHNVTGLSGV